jgi:hypothetical protein
MSRERVEYNEPLDLFGKKLVKSAANNIRVLIRIVSRICWLNPGCSEHFSRLEEVPKIA